MTTIQSQDEGEGNRSSWLAADLESEELNLCQ